MTKRPRRLAVLALGLVLVGCAATGKTGATKPSPPASAPLTTTLSTPSASWAIVPMGHLADPLNTFWQVFVLPHGGHSWQLVTPPGVADNGGLVASASNSARLVVGFLPSQDLNFSPVAITSDNGNSYLPDIVGGGLADQPDALSIATDGGAIALVNHGASLLTRSAASAPWQRVATLSSLASSPAGRACGIDQLTAVFAADSGTYVGLDCTRPGVVGIWVRTGSAFHPTRVVLPRALAADHVQVLRLIGYGDQFTALLRLNEAGRVSYAVAWATAQHPAWTLSAAIARQGSLISTAAGVSGDVAILTATPSAGLALDLIGPGQQAWTTLPAPLRATVTVAITRHRIDAFTVSTTRLTDYTFNSATGRWTQAQVINVPISFGSSN